MSGRAPGDLPGAASAADALRAGSRDFPVLERQGWLAIEQAG